MAASTIKRPFRISELQHDHNGVALLAFQTVPRKSDFSLLTQSATALPTDTKRASSGNSTPRSACSLGWDLRGSYIGSRGQDLNYTLNINKAPASSTAFSTSRLPYPQFVYATNRRQWHYDSQAQAHKYAGGVTFDSSFTWANNTSNYLNTNDPYHDRSMDPRRRRPPPLFRRRASGWPFGKGKKFLNGGPNHRPHCSRLESASSGHRRFRSILLPLFTGPDPVNAVRFVTALPDCTGDELRSADHRTVV